MCKRVPTVVLYAGIIDSKLNSWRWSLDLGMISLLCFSADFSCFPTGGPLTSRPKSTENAATLASGLKPSLSSLSEAEKLPDSVLNPSCQCLARKLKRLATRAVSL